MGWLFAVARGLQKKSAAAVWQALVPIAVGHFLAIALVVAAAGLAGIILPLLYLKFATAAILLAFGLFLLFRKSHPRWGGMQIGFRDLAIWSFLMASAHGAGFMLLPVLLKMSASHDAVSHASMDVSEHSGHMHLVSAASPWTAPSALLVHTLGYLLVTGLAAFVVYKKLNLEVLRTAWINLDLIWAIALIVTAVFTLLIPS